MTRRKRRALIIGCAGQDGRLLFEERSATCDVLGIDVDLVRLHGIDRDVVGQTPPNIHERQEMSAVVGSFHPDELYYLAARHHSAEERPQDADELAEAMRVNFDAYVNVLEAVRQEAPKCRVFYAASSHVFGAPITPVQSESTPLSPENPYAISKVAGIHASRLFRARHGLHVSVGFLYNHESPIRAPQFVSQRISMGAKRAAREPGLRLQLGSLASVVDWGYAPDYVRAMTLIVGEDAPGDYVVATGVPHTVQDFVEVAFKAAGVDWKKHVVVDEGRVASGAGSPFSLVGDASKLRGHTGWAPSITFEEMVSRLVAAAP